MSQPTRVALAEDHPVIRKAVRAALAAHPDVEVVCEAVDGDEALSCCREHRPDVLLLDLRMPGMPAVELVPALAAELPQLCVLILSANEDPTTLTILVKAGINGYLVKDDAPYELVQGVRAVAQGTPYYSVTMLRKHKALLERLGALA